MTEQGNVPVPTVSGPEPAIPSHDAQSGAAPAFPAGYASGAPDRTGSSASPVSAELSDALLTLHQAVQSVHLPRNAIDVARVREEREHALRLLETYALPRLDDREAPLVVVISGPTGAGKSTLTNSLIGDQVSLSGVMRPTTREPVLAYNPMDTAGLRRLGLLPAEHVPDDRSGQNRGGPADPGPTTGSAYHRLRPRAVPSEDVVPGLALIDSPDIDSRLDSNRETAHRLLDAADLLVFVTTGTDYADAMSWTVLAEAAARKISIAVVVNRLTDREATTVRGHFATLLRDAGLGHAYVFVVPEARLVDERLPVRLVSTIQRWLNAQARRSQTPHVRRTMDGTIDQVVATVRRLADGVDEQSVTARRIAVDVEGVFSVAREAVRVRTGNGSQVTATLAAACDAVYAPAAPAAPQPRGMFRRKQRPVAEAAPVDPDQRVVEEITASLVGLLREQVGQAVVRAGQRRGHPVEPDATGAHLPPDFGRRSHQAVAAWLHRLNRRTAGEMVEDAIRSPEPDSPTSAGPVDPVTVALAASTLLARPGLNTGEAVDVQLNERVRRFVARRLTEHDLTAEADDLSRDAWLDLVLALTQVVQAEEIRQIEALEGVAIPADTAGLIRQAAEQVALHHNRQVVANA